MSSSLLQILTTWNIGKQYSRRVFETIELWNGGKQEPERITIIDKFTSLCTSFISYMYIKRYTFQWNIYTWKSILLVHRFIRLLQLFNKYSSLLSSWVEFKEQYFRLDFVFTDNQIILKLDILTCRWGLILLELYL